MTTANIIEILSSKLKRMLYTKRKKSAGFILKILFVDHILLILSSRNEISFKIMRQIVLSQRKERDRLLKGKNILR